MAEGRSQDTCSSEDNRNALQEEDTREHDLPSREYDLLSIEDAPDSIDDLLHELGLDWEEGHGNDSIRDAYRSGKQSVRGMLYDLGLASAASSDDDEQIRNILDDSASEGELNLSSFSENRLRGQQCDTLSSETDGRVPLSTNEMQTPSWSNWQSSNSMCILGSPSPVAAVVNRQSDPINATNGRGLEAMGNNSTSPIISHSGALLSSMASEQEGQLDSLWRADCVGPHANDDICHRMLPKKQPRVKKGTARKSRATENSKIAMERLCQKPKADNSVTERPGNVIGGSGSELDMEFASAMEVVVQDSPADGHNNSETEVSSMSYNVCDVDDLLVMNSKDFSSEEKEFLLIKDKKVRHSSSDLSYNSASTDQEGSEEDEGGGKESETLDEEDSEEVELPDLVKKLCHLVSSNNPSAIQQFLRKHEDLQQDLCLTSHTNGESAVTLAGTLGLLKILKLFSELGIFMHHPDSEGYMAIHRAAHNGHARVVEYLTELGQWDSKTKSGFTALHIAATVGNVKMTKILVSHVTNLDESCEFGWTPLHMASQGGHHQVIRILLEHGADVKSKNCYNETALYIAAQHGHTKVLETLLEMGAEINQQNHEGTTSLYIATQKGKIAAIELLLQKGADPNIQDCLGWAPLHKATHMGNVDLMELLLDHSADIELKNNKEINCLLLAATDTLLKPLQVLIKRGADLNSQDSAGWSALHSSTQGHQVAATTTLLNHGINPNIKNIRSITPLYIAARKGFSDIVALLLQEGATVNAASLNGWNPLHIACQFEQVAIVKLLLAADAEVDTPTTDGSTPLLISIDRRNKDLVDVFTKDKPMDLAFICSVARFRRTKYLSFLSSSGYIDLKAKDAKGWNALHYAAHTGDHLAAWTLIEVMVNINVVDLDGNTALHIACQAGHFNVVSTLLNARAMVNGVNRFKETCLMFAVGSGKEDIAMLLIQNGAHINSCDNVGDTCLLRAIKANKPIMVDLLLDNDADMNLCQGGSTLPIHLAASLGYTTVLSILTRRGADPGAASNTGDTCLHMAAAEGHLDTVLDLVANRLVDVNSKNMLQMKALHVAAAASHTWIVEALLDAGTTLALLDEDGKPVYELAKHQAIWDMVKEWSKHHPNVQQTGTDMTGIDIEGAQALFHLLNQAPEPRSRRHRTSLPESHRLNRVLEMLSSAARPVSDDDDDF